MAASNSGLHPLLESRRLNRWIFIKSSRKTVAQPSETSKATAFAVRAANAERVKRVLGKKHLKITLKFKLSDMAILTVAGQVMQL